MICSVVKTQPGDSKEQDQACKIEARELFVCPTYMDTRATANDGQTLGSSYLIQY